ncbi:hypothetical protein ALC57_09212 [Trachymyrmex cornetzi]|uniref:Uncharacterized protein n=1 Tax=Trachymyrmex cornetzi TaxID=471704 RepID=A0A195E0S1_9HYME|nr:hypothetical protein ALC57_09212 [Trachymyrmex cornetzi]
MPPKRQGRRAELLLASPTAPECLVFAIGLRRIAARAFRRLLPKRIRKLRSVAAVAGEHVLDVYCPCTGPTVLRDSDYVPAYDLILLRNANDIEEGWMGFRSSEILRQGLEGGPIVLRARGFRKISALTGVTTPVTLFVPEKQQRPRPNAAPTSSFPPTAFAIKQKPLEIEFVRKVKRSDRLLGSPLVPAFPYPPLVYRHRDSHRAPRTSAFRFLSAAGFSANEGRDAHSRTNLLSNRNAREVRKKIEMRVQI